MFDFFFRTRPKTRPATPRQTRLNVEALESRYCPTVTLSLSLQATPTSGTTVLLTGNETATGESPTATTISISGTMSGKVTPAANGSFSFKSTASGLGTVEAVATDGAGNTSNQAPAQIDNWAGWGLTLTATPGSGKTVQLAGQVTNPGQGQTQITLGGVMSGTITPNANGSFAYQGTASQLGSVSATLTDSSSNVQAIAQATVQCAAPSISNLAISIVSGTTVTVTGTVTAPNPGRLVVSFSGPVTSTTTTNSNGTFSLTTTASQLGTVTAHVTDLWNQTSAPATVVLSSPPPNITSFVCSSSGTVWVLEGQLSNANAEGWTVSFTGVPGNPNLTTTVLENGSFWESVSFPNQANVVITATVTDCWGQTDSDVYVVS